MNDLSNLNNIELNNRLTSLKEELEDLEKQKELYFEQTGLHIVSDKVNLQSKEYEKDILNLEERIGQIAVEIKRRGL